MRPNFIFLRKLKTMRQTFKIKISWRPIKFFSTNFYPLCKTLLWDFQILANWFQLSAFKVLRAGILSFGEKDTESFAISKENRHGGPFSIFFCGRNDWKWWLPTIGRFLIRGKFTEQVTLSLRLVEIVNSNCTQRFCNCIYCKYKECIFKEKCTQILMWPGNNC